MTLSGRISVNEPHELHVGYSGHPIAPAGSTGTTHAEMHDVFIVVSEGTDGEPTARTVYAADEDDARRAHQQTYADETIVTVNH